MSTDLHVESCSTETPLPRRKRVASYASVSKFSSSKRRRMSMFGGDLDIQEDVSGGSTLRLSNSVRKVLVCYEVVTDSLRIQVDRFVPTRPKTTIPLSATPRTNRISRQFGLSDSRVLNFKENNPEEDNKMYGMLRRSASNLFNTPPPPCVSSVVANLTRRQQCVMVLDGPGMSKDPHATPITWSLDNRIAVACGRDIFYQDLETRAVTRLCTLDVAGGGELCQVQWGGPGRERQLALGTTGGIMQVWDAGQDSGNGTLLRMWHESNSLGVGALDWNRDLVAVGLQDGSISLFDVRSAKETRRVSVHKSRILGLKWNGDGSVMASSDDLGMVYIWDKRAGKGLLEEGTQGSKMRHRGPVKALAWCPWKPDLLATGSTYPEGTIRVWSSSSPLSLPAPTLTIPLDTSVLSLHWSPHCKELLSTHGSSFSPLPLTRGPVSAVLPPAPLKGLSTPLTNSITVHNYPSGKRLLNLTTAHLGPVTHSCLAPNGEDIFTVCPREETIKKWHVWSKRPDTGKKESAFDKWSIR
ncbi:hypothetical protein DXG01_011104 [Tephrocybe rancida]|nr:hypothetical protein DXG01_011104 [Tephrocybe rancida]